MGDVVGAQDVDDSLVADAGVGRRLRRVAGVVGGLGRAGGGTGGGSTLEGVVCGEREELRAHVGVGVGLRIVGGVDGSAKGYWGREVFLAGGRGVLVVAVGSADDNVEVIWSSVSCSSGKL